MILTGLESILRTRKYANKRIGLITNHTGIDNNLRQNVTVMKTDGWNITALFAPEHGLYGEAPAGETIDGFHDPVTGIPVYSLYGKTNVIDKEMLNRVDVLIYDMQDIGGRFWTYTSTMMLCQEAASKYGIPFVVLDRPNPIGGIAVEGNIASEDKFSLVAGAPIPIRHGMTSGEIALFYQDYKSLNPVTVIPMRGWTRDMYLPDTGLTWVIPSPAIPTMDSAICFPGICLVEGINASEGRGTSLPFQLIGAPWAQAGLLDKAIRALNLPGIAVRPAYFKPSTSKHGGTVCKGIQLHVLDARLVKPVEMGVKLLFTMKDLFPEFSLIKSQNTGSYWLDSLTADTALRNALESGKGWDSLLEDWENQSLNFISKRKDYLLYKRENT